ncbi:uncharacterized protein I206_100148 [Kwoniella pini CBS 10737]|uniref:Uncharacterized protein n=1 Tax=Kwoniella pini CBS 10737 TaxID=1296096 RepID=A0A1B9IE95_9TREE|nr:uncharacterized protein I206_01179 [Kwoniella pini CBS 10737]OCF53872.1 hypothetical protein I206_01179 [Kwoniella pini CBS 10737]
MTDLNPPSSSSSFDSSIKRQLSSLSEDETPNKRVYAGSAMTDIRPANHLTPSRGQTDGEESEEEMVVVRKDKGKGKMKMVYLPELPEEVWTRIFEIYYEDDTSQWHSTGVLKSGLTPVLLSRDHARIALPVLYRHPYLGYKAIDPFLVAIITPSRYTELPLGQYIKHLTIRASPMIPSSTPIVSLSTESVRHTVHPSFRILLRALPELTSFTLKDTLLLHAEDVSLLFAGLESIKPIKARLEFRLWNLYDSPYGQDIISATHGGAYASSGYGKRSIIANPVTPAENTHPDVEFSVQKAWRDAMYQREEFDVPSGWTNTSMPTRFNVPTPTPLGPGHFFNPALIPPIPPMSFNSGQPTSQGDATVNLFPLSTIAADPSNASLGDGWNPAAQFRRPRLDGWEDFGWGQDHFGNMRRRADRSHAGVANLLRTPNDVTVALTSSSGANSTSLSEHLDGDEDYEETYRLFRQGRARGYSTESSDRGSGSGSSVDAVAGTDRTDQTITMTAQTPSTSESENHWDTSVRNHRDDAFHRNGSVFLAPTSSGLTPLSVPQPQSSCVRTYPRNAIHTAVSTMSLNEVNSVRPLLRRLVVDCWTPRLQALSIVALDPLASLLVRSPTLDFWPQIPIPHTRVHLPMSMDPLVIFKDTKQVARDEIRRRAGQGRLGNNNGNGTDPNPMPLGNIGSILSATTPNGTSIADIAHQLTQLAHAENEGHKIVGGDGMGNRLIHEKVKLFEIEINSIEEMQNEVWIRHGDQLPSQLCRILAGQNDWREVNSGDFNDTYSPPYSEFTPPDSPATSDYDSPAFSFVSSDEDHDSNAGDESEGATGNITYDKGEAEEQALRIKAREARRSE